MKVKGDHFETIWINRDDPAVVQIIDQRYLPFDFRIEDLRTAGDMYLAIRDMHLRGAPLIGAAGALGMYLALVNMSGTDSPEVYIARNADMLKSSRPTAVNLAWAVDRASETIRQGRDKPEMIDAARKVALSIINEERANCLKIGQYGMKLIEDMSRKNGGKPVNILTHCNAGWLACIEFGTAMAPIYTAFDQGIPVHVWVDETRPLNQGPRLPAWELGKHGVSHAIITDNAGGHLMQHGKVDLVIVGTDRTTRAGDVANKIGTYLKALAAKDNDIPFYVALPSSTFDWEISDGIAGIPIEERNPDEIRYVQGLLDGKAVKVLVPPENSPAANHAFDVTPARLVTGFITERGICRATRESILSLFPEKKRE